MHKRPKIESVEEYSAANYTLNLNSITSPSCTT
jgi:hypothetical protein